MKQIRIPAVFMRGGTSNAVVFHARDLPRDRALWDDIFLAAIGSPDPYGRQLDGMGGGVSSLSKVCVIGPASRPDADIDYTFAQVLVKEARVDYSANCGNMSSAMGPFAVDGELAIPGGSGTGAPGRLEFREPGGATTGKLLPTGNVVDTLDVTGCGKVRVSMVDAANACVFVRAADLGVTGTELPDEIDA